MENGEYFLDTFCGEKETLEERQNQKGKVKEKQANPYKIVEIETQAIQNHINENVTDKGKHANIKQLKQDCVLNLEWVYLGSSSKQ